MVEIGKEEDCILLGELVLVVESSTLPLVRAGDLPEDKRKWAKFNGFGFSSCRSVLDH